MSLVAPIAAYLGRRSLGVSGVLATVTAGLITGRRAARVLSPDGRLMGHGVWRPSSGRSTRSCSCSSGCSCRPILATSTEVPPAQLLGLGLAVSLTVIVARFVWVFPGTYLPRMLSARIRAPSRTRHHAPCSSSSWAGMRGVVSLAAALGLADRLPPARLILFLTFCVIVATLVGQGLTLPWLIRRLGIVAGDRARRRRPMRAWPRSMPPCAGSTTSP